MFQDYVTCQKIRPLTSKMIARRSWKRNNAAGSWTNGPLVRTGSKSKCRQLSIPCNLHRLAVKPGMRMRRSIVWQRLTQVERSRVVDYVNKFIRKASFSGVPQLRFRFGLGQPGSITWQPWQLHRITSPAAVPEGIGKTAGHFLELTTEDGLYALGLSTKITARRGTISSIVQQIATENQILDVVIEPTTGEFLMIQASQEDSHFIRQRLIRRAANSRGRGNYLFYMRDGVLHFHTPDYQGQAYELQYYRANGASITQNDNSQMMIEHGSAGVRMITYNPLTGEVKEIDSAPDRALRFGNVIPDYSAIPQVQLNVPYHHSANGVEEAVNIAQNTYENARMQCFKLSMELDKIIFHAGDIVRVVLAPAADKTTPWSGLWFVAEASHNIVKNAIRSTYVMQRGELLNLLGGQKTVADAERSTGNGCSSLPQWAYE